jgi:hypothetical protein
MSLSVLSLQLQFQQHLLGAADAAPLIAGSDARRSLGLGIYANAYRLRLLETLSDAYQKTQSVMGEVAFEAAAFGYIASHPPTTRSLRWYGDRFSNYLVTQHPEAPAHAEMARLDWALRTAFDGPDAAALDAAALGAIEPEAWATLRLVPVPTAELLVFGHNTVAMWQALDDGESPPPLTASPIEVDWLVWRKRLQPHFRSLHRVEARLLRAMRDGSSFAQACHHAGSLAADIGLHDGELSVLIGGFMQQWLEDQLIARITV